MKPLSCLKYGLLAVHVAASGAICLLADALLRFALALSGAGAGQIRSLQFALMAFLAMGVLVGAALADKRFSRAQSVAALIASACGVFAAQGILLGALGLGLALYGLSGWLNCILAFLISAVLLVARAYLARQKRKDSVQKINF